MRFNWHLHWHRPLTLPTLWHLWPLTSAHFSNANLGACCVVFVLFFFLGFVWLADGNRLINRGPIVPIHSFFKWPTSSSGLRLVRLRSHDNDDSSNGACRREHGSGRSASVVFRQVRRRFGRWRRQGNALCAPQHTASQRFESQSAETLQGQKDRRQSRTTRRTCTFIHSHFQQLIESNDSSSNELVVDSVQII